MANPTAPLTAIADPYRAYNDLINQQVAGLQAQQSQANTLDPMTMLAIAQGFLAPTRTGSFGESLGNAAGQAIGPLSRARTADQDRMDKISKLRETQVKLAMEKQRIDDLNKRAAAGYDRDPSLVYGTSMTGLGRELEAYPDPDQLISLDQSTPEGKARADYLRNKRNEILQSMEAQRKKLLGGGASAGAGSSARSASSDDETETPRRSAAAPTQGTQAAAMGGGNRGASQPSGAAPAQAGKAGRVASDTDLQSARDAYNRGAPIQAILKRFKENGITGITPEDITGK